MSGNDRLVESPFQQTVLTLWPSSEVGLVLRLVAAHSELAKEEAASQQKIEPVAEEAALGQEEVARRRASRIARVLDHR